MPPLQHPNSDAAPFVLPTPFQLALARALIRSKPSHLNVAEEYIDHLRQHICSGKRQHVVPLQPESANSYIETVAYWKALYHDSANREEHGKNEIWRLERRVETLDVLVESLHKSTSHGHTNGKRKKVTEQAGRSTKKVKTANILDFSPHDDIVLARLQNAAPGQHDTLLRQVFRLQVLLQQDTTMDPVEFACALNSTASLLDSSIASLGEVQDPHGSTALNVQSEKDIQASYRALAHILAILAEGFKKLTLPFSRTESDISGSMGTVIYSITSIFRTLLSCLRDAAKAYSVSASVQESASMVTDRSGTRTQTNSNVRPNPSAHLAPTAILANFFLTTFTEASPNSSSTQAHAAVHEGLLHLLLTRAGTLLYTLVFSCPRAATLAKEFENLPPHPTKFHPRSLVSAHNLDDVSGAQLEATYLVPLLRCLLARSPILYRTGDVDLVSPVLRRLQNTLVLGVFGAPLGETLRLPEDVGGSDGLAGVGEVEEENKGNWFVRQMWEMCGWGILGEQDTEKIRIMR